MINLIPAELTIATYAYRGDGKLFQETYAFGTPYKRFHWDGWRLIGEEDNTGTLQRSYVQQPGVPYGATLAEAPGSNPGAADYRYFGRDSHGSTRAIFAQDKARIGTADWHPYGIQRQGFGLSSALAFTGQWKSSYTGDYQFGLRTYSPGLARWLSRDPMGYVDGPNMHGYAKANPIGYIDAQGGGVFAPIFLGIVSGGLLGGIKAGICGDPIWSGILVGAAIGGATATAVLGFTWVLAVAKVPYAAYVGEVLTGGGMSGAAGAAVSQVKDDLGSFAFGLASGAWGLAAEEGLRSFASGLGCGSRSY